MNARRPLRISSYDGSGQHVHPDVLFVADGLHGFRFWMAVTPYPSGNDRLENPSLRVSNDGIDWIPFPGAPDPLVEAPVDRDAHNADPDLVLANGRLHLFFMTRNRRERVTTFSVIWSDDGRSWSEPVEVYRDMWGVSPAVVEHGGVWQMWYILLDTSDPASRSHLLVQSGAKPIAFADPQKCQLVIPGHVPWHIDVQRFDDSGYEALVAAFPEGSNNAHTRLFHCSSRDGRTFTPTRPDPIISPSRLAWDAMMVYRSTFVRTGDRYTIWYSGGSWNRRHGIGLVSGPLTDLHPLDGPRGSHLSTARIAADNLIGLAKAGARRVLPAALSNRLRRLFR